MDLEAKLQASLQHTALRKQKSRPAKARGYVVMPGCPGCNVVVPLRVDGSHYRHSDNYMLMCIFCDRFMCRECLPDGQQICNFCKDQLHECIVTVSAR